VISATDQADAGQRERSCRRGDLFAKRVALMDDWAAYLAKPAADIVRPGFRAAMQIVT
jgi:hypothetical protein